jgi:hypothetical protein
LRRGAIALLLGVCLLNCSDHKVEILLTKSDVSQIAATLKSLDRRAEKDEIDGVDSPIATEQIKIFDIFFCSAEYQLSAIYPMLETERLSILEQKIIVLILTGLPKYRWKEVFLRMYDLWDKKTVSDAAFDLFLSSGYSFDLIDYATDGEVRKRLMSIAASERLDPSRRSWITNYVLTSRAKESLELSQMVPRREMCKHRK